MSTPRRKVSVPNRGWTCRPKPATIRPSVGHGSWPRSTPSPTAGGRGPPGPAGVAPPLRQQGAAALQLLVDGAPLRLDRPAEPAQLPAAARDGLLAGAQALGRLAELGQPRPVRARDPRPGGEGAD